MAGQFYYKKETFIVAFAGLIAYTIMCLFYSVNSEFFFVKFEVFMNVGCVCVIVGIERSLMHKAGRAVRTVTYNILNMKAA